MADFRSITRVGRMAAAAALLTFSALAGVPAGASVHHAPAHQARVKDAGDHGRATKHRHARRHGHAALEQRGCSRANTASAGASTKAMRSAVVCLINRERVAHGLPALRTSRRLDRSAQGWTNAMVATQSFTHGADFSARITAAGFTWSSAGENIATGFPTPQAVVEAWMASPDHCQNILNPTYSYVGTGLNRHPVAAFGSGPATWTQDFALPMGQPAPSGNWGPERGCPY